MSRWNREEYMAASSAWSAHGECLMMITLIIRAVG